MSARPRPSALFACAAGLVVTTGACGASNEEYRPPPMPPSTTHADAKEAAGPDPAGAEKASPDPKADQVGLATWYGAAFAGRKTANGERFDPTKLTAAHRSLPFGTWVEVRRVDTGHAVRVRITDRGPFGDPRRIIDLSRKAAEDLGIVRDGVAKVELRIVGGP